MYWLALFHLILKHNQRHWFSKISKLIVTVSIPAAGYTSLLLSPVRSESWEGQDSSTDVSTRSPIWSKINSDGKSSGPSSKGSSPETIPLASLSQTHFIAEILGGVAENELLENASRWYIIFLECKIRKAWRSLFIPVLRNAVSTPPSDEDLALAFQILQIIINRAKQENLALIELVDSLDNSHLLKSPDPDDEERAEANQLVLAAFGWITSLYSASDNPAPSKLELNIPRGSSGTELPERAKSRISRTFHRRRSVAKETYITLSQTLQLYDQPLYTLLEAFGTVLPQRPQSWNLRSSHTVSEDTSLVRQPDHDKIEASFLCYHTLAKIAKVKIDWVDSLSLHLEFDMQAKVLKLFRLPSLCLLMCCASPLSWYVCPSGLESEEL